MGTLLRRLQAHPATEHVLTDIERGVLASALASYQRECMQEAKAMRNPTSLFAGSVRKAAEANWNDRAAIAHRLYNEILPINGSATITVRS